MGSLVVKLVVLVFFAGSNAFAEADQEKESDYCWGKQQDDLNASDKLDLYQGTGTWQDNQGASGKIEALFAIESTTDYYENFWLTIKYDGIKQQVYVSRDTEYYPYRLYGLDDKPIGTAVCHGFACQIIRGIGLKTKLTYRFSAYYTIVRSKNNVLSGTIEEKPPSGTWESRSVSWEDLKLVFKKTVLKEC